MEIIVARLLLGVVCIFSCVVSASISMAQEEFEVTAFRKSSSSYYEIVIQGTKKDQEIVCALKNAQDDIIATDTQYADALATKVLINYEGDDVKSVICVPNE